MTVFKTESNNSKVNVFHDHNYPYSFRFIGRVLAEIINLNDASGWKMQIQNSGIDGIFEISLIIFLIICLIFDIKKEYRNILISKLHLISISICGIFDSFGNIDISIYLSIVICGILLFLFNLYLIIKKLPNNL